MKTKIAIVLSLLLLVFVACEKNNLKTADNNVAVVEAYLMPEKPVEIKISKQIIYQSGDTTVHYLDTLQVKLIRNDSVFLCSYQGEGIYGNSEIVLHESDSLRLEFEYNKQLVYAETVIPAKPQDFTESDTVLTVPDFSEGITDMPDPVELTWTNNSNDYYLVIVKSIDENAEAISSGMGMGGGHRSFRSMPLQSNSQEINSMSFSYYGLHDIILYRLNKEYASLYNNSGSSSLNITQPPSNVTNGLGIFTGISTDTLKLTIDY